MTECFEVPQALATTGHTPPSGMPSQDADRPTASSEDLRLAFRRHAGAVAVITAAGASGPVGFTASSLASVSVDPPLVSFNIARSSSSWPAVSVASHLGVHVLAEDQRDLAERFAAKGVERFAAPTRWTPGPFRVPLLEDVAARLVVTPHQQVRAGDHILVVARVVHADATEGAVPLIHHDGGFHTLRRNGFGWRRRRV